MINRHFRKIAVLVAILAILLAACGPQETETPEPTEEPVAVETEEETEEPVEATAEAVEATEEATEEVVEATAEAVEATEEMTEEPMDMEATEEMTEEPMDMEATEEMTEEPMDMEATEEMTEEPMDMESTEEPMGSVVTYDDGAGFSFDYPEGYELTTNVDGSVITLNMGEQRLIVITPANWALVIGSEEGTLEEQLLFFVERLGYTAGESSDMMMSDASISVEIPRRGLVGYANLSDLDNGNFAVVIELGPDADSIPSADGAVISGSLEMLVVAPEPVAVGDTLAGSITAGNRVSYELTLADAEVVNIYLNGIDGLDTYLRIYDAEGNLIAENDDFSGVSSGLEGFSVDGGGVVTVEVGTYADSEAGDYELVVEVATVEEEATEEPMEATEEAMEATEEPMEATEEPMEEMDAEPLTILGLALQTENLDTLATAVVRGEFLSTFNGEDVYTVFAPTDDAFSAALEALGLTAEELFDDEELLNSVLTYHVVEGAVLSGDLEDGMEVETVNGAVLTIGVTDDGVTVTDGQGNTYSVVTADVEASNGVVHIIDGVLLPPTE